MPEVYPKHWCYDCGLVEVEEEDDCCAECIQAANMWNEEEEPRLCVVCEDQPVADNEVYYCADCLYELEQFEDDELDVNTAEKARQHGLCTSCFSAPPMRGRDLCKICYEYEVWAEGDHREPYGDGWDWENTDTVVYSRPAPVIIPSAEEEVEKFGAMR